MADVSEIGGQLVSTNYTLIDMCHCHCGCHVTGGHSRKRRRTTEVVDIEDRLESLITRVGEKVGHTHLRQVRGQHKQLPEI